MKVDLLAYLDQPNAEEGFAASLPTQGNGLLPRGRWWIRPLKT